MLLFLLAHLFCLHTQVRHEVKLQLTRAWRQGIRHACTAACSKEEVLDFLNLWRENAVQTQLWNCCRNKDYSDVAEGMQKLGYDREKQQWWAKEKELQQSYQ